MTNSKYIIKRVFVVFLSCLVLLAVMNTAQAANSNVQKTQQILKDQGYEPGPADGLFGAKTRSALKKYQEDNNLPKTGQIDKATAGALGVKVYTPPKRRPTVSNSVNQYEHCIRTIVDRHLASKTNPIKQYAFGPLPKEGGFGGYIAYKSGAVIRIGEKDESSAVTLFSQAIADFTYGVDWMGLKTELQNTCSDGS